MRKVEAIIRPEKLDPVRLALEACGISEMTVTEVSGRGNQGGILLQWGAKQHRVEFLAKVKIEVIVQDKECPLVIDAICLAAQTGVIGDGKIFVMPVEQVVRVRTGERDELAV